MSNKWPRKNTGDAALTLEQLGKLRRAVSLLGMHFLKPFGLGPKQAAILKFLAQRGQSTLTELSILTVSDPAAVGRSLSCLSRKGYIVQRYDVSDRRRRVIVLSKKGSQMANEVINIFNNIAGQTTANLSVSERKTFISIVDKMISAIPHGEVFLSNGQFKKAGQNV